MHTSTDTLDQELTFSRFDRMSEKYPDRSAHLSIWANTSPSAA